MKKTLIAILALVTITTSCKNTEKKADNSYTVTITGAEHFPEGAIISVYRLKTEESPERAETLKSEAFNSEGFVLEGTVNEVHNISFDVLNSEKNEVYNSVYFPLAPGKTDITFTDKDHYTYKGGKYGELVVNSVNNNKDYQKAWDDLLNYNVTDFKDSIQRATYFKLNGRVNDLQQELLGKVVNESEDPLVKLLVYNAGYYGDRRVDVNAVIENLVKEVGLEHRQSKVAMLAVKARREHAATSKTVQVGSVIKDFEAKSLKGETFHLADVLKENKYVLVEFWASWCGPCRGEIPHMKKAYSHYKDKGFEIVSFSLDHKEEAWKKASETEQIPWIDTGDLLAYTSPVAKLYGVRGIPANYLVEAATGKIIAKDLRQEKLDNKLAEILN